MVDCVRWLVVLVFVWHAVVTVENDYCERDASGSCKKLKKTCDDEDEPCFDEERDDTTLFETSGYPKFNHLTRLKGVKVGHAQEYTIDGFNFKLITRSLKPLLFEIPNAMTDTEIDHVLEKARNENKSGGLFKSEARGGLTPEDEFKPSDEVGKAYGPAALFEHWDVNNNDVIDMEEVALFARSFNFLYFKEYDARKMVEILKLKEFEDGRCTKSEFETLNTFGIEDYLNRVMREHPKFRQRTSDQVWLPMAKEYDQMISKIRYRFGKLLKVPERVLLGSEHMQVVRYSKGGHYHAHHDSETETATDKPCCHHTSTKIVSSYGRCRLCRFITIMVYLHEPEEGGETAFPAADNITYTESAFRHRGHPAKDLYNLSEHCYDANLVLKAKKGTAVVWYNHHVDYKGWLGSLDEWSLHGGCEIRKGEKWIANLWLTAPYKDAVHKVSMYSMEYMESTKDQQL